MIRIVYTIGMMAIVFLLSLNSIFAQAVEPQRSGTAFPAFQLPVPTNELESGYLGLSKKGSFRVGEIKADIVLIEILSAYCPHCQRVAPLVDEVYEQIQKDPALKGKIKVIGIGAGNSAYELNLFKEKFKVPFPLFPDENSTIADLLKVPGTPTFVGVRVDGKGFEQQVFYKPGTFKDSSQFLADLAQAASLK